MIKHIFFFIDTHKCKYNLLVLIQGGPYVCSFTDLGVTAHLGFLSQPCLPNWLKPNISPVNTTGPFTTCVICFLIAAKLNLIPTERSR
jgi:hypothetical protein